MWPSDSKSMAEIITTLAKQDTLPHVGFWCFFIFSVVIYIILFEWEPLRGNYGGEKSYIFSKNRKYIKSIVI